MTEHLQLYEWRGDSGANPGRTHGSSGMQPQRSSRRVGAEEHKRANANYDEPDQPLQTPPPLSSAAALPAQRSWMLCMSPRTPDPDVHSDLGPAHACGPHDYPIMAPMPSTVEYSTGVPPRCPPNASGATEGDQRPSPPPSGSKGVAPRSGTSRFHPPSQLELEHFRHLSVESIVHTRTSVGLVPGHAVCFLSSMLPQLFTEGDLSLMGLV